MKKKESKPLKAALLEAVNKVLIAKKMNMTNKLKKRIEKSVKRIAKKTKHLIPDIEKKQPHNKI